MATYAIGDIQGCFDEFQQLLEAIRFDASKDTLWLAGDLINRGPKSLETLRFIRHLTPAPRIVLGNHDLHLLASWVHGKSIASKDTLQPILEAEDCEDLCHWLRRQPLIVEDQALNFVMVHAGFLPQWTIAQVRAYAAEVQKVLQSDGYKDFLLHMYSNADNQWNDALTGAARLRTLVNTFTRLRYCDNKGKMALTEKGPLGSQPAGLIPWYAHPERNTQDQRIIFGHWAALEGAILGDYNVFSIDTGCVWGRQLRALSLNDLSIIEVASQQRRRFT